MNMCQNILFSIIVPVYNSQDYIGECLESILSQDYSNYQVIVVDDGSTDSSCEVIKKYQRYDNRIMLLEEKHSNAGNARNVGVEHAEGEWLIFVDSDDCVNKSLLSTIFNQIEDTECDIIAFKAEYYNDKTKQKSNIDWVYKDELIPQENPFSPEKYANNIFQMFSTNIWNKAFRKNTIVDNHIMFSSLADANDEFFGSMALVCAKHIAYIDKALYYYRINTGISTQDNAGRNASILFISALKEISGGLKARNLFQYYENSFFEKAIVEVINSIIKQKEWQNIKKVYDTGKKALFHDLDIPKDYSIGNEHYSVWLDYLKKNTAEQMYSIIFLPERRGIGTAYVKKKHKVSVVMPTYNAASRIHYAIDSIINQTFSDWELLVVNEHTTTDETADIVKKYMQRDSRIKLITNGKREGLAESINIGIGEANGDYIARMDADDLAHKERLEKQVAYLEENKDVGVLGTWQHHFGRNDWIHCPARKYDKCRAILLFDCNMCHSTVMMRRELFSDIGYKYDKNSSIEDFKLWTELMRITKIENIPEVLGEYYEGDNNISNEKMDIINDEYSNIVAQSLKSVFDIDIDRNDRKLFEFRAALKTKNDYLEERLKAYINEIFYRNQEVNFCNDAVMMHVLHYWWVREHTGEILFNKKIQTYNSIDDICFID